MGCGHHSDPSAAIRAQQQQQQLASQQAVAGINKAFQGFNEPFYQNVSNSYLQQALPQLQTQFQDAAKNLTFQQARQGFKPGSTPATTQAAMLSGQQAQAQSALGQQATDEANKMRTQVAQEQQALIGQAGTALDPQALIQQAMTTAAGTAGPLTFAPIGQALGNLGQMYATNGNANMYNDYVNQYL